VTVVFCQVLIACRKCKTAS